LPKILNDKFSTDERIMFNPRTLYHRGDIGAELPFSRVLGYTKSAQSDKYEAYCADCEPSIWVTYPLLKRILECIAGVAAFIVAGFIMLLVGFWGLTLHNNIYPNLLSYFWHGYLFCICCGMFPLSGCISFKLRLRGKG
jgi:hypothetical protein